MEHKKFWTAVSKVLAATAVILIIVLVLAPGAGAQSHHKVLHWFYQTGYDHLDGTTPYGNLVFDADGNLYGTTAYGWSSNCYWHGCGSVFQLTRNENGGWTENVLMDDSFQTDPGSWPMAGIVFDAAGNLYGTAAGDYSCCGRIFKGVPNPDGTWTWSTLYWFTGGSDGATSYAPLVLDADGNLYGTTVNGGVYGLGVVFKLAPNQDGTWTESVVHSFEGPDGANPYSGLIFDSAGSLYGTTRNGGFAGCGGPGCGTLYKLTPSGSDWALKVLHRFSISKDGANPNAGVTFDGAGNLYGTTINGGRYGYGVVFKATPNPDGGWSGKVLHHFTGTRDGANPYGGVVLDTAGNVYGTTYYGGSWGFGVVYKLTPSPDGKWTGQLLHTFNGKPGLRPYASLVLDAEGHLYGTTVEGHQDCGWWTNDCGTVFEITP